MKLGSSRNRNTQNNNQNEIFYTSSQDQLNLLQNNHKIFTDNAFQEQNLSHKKLQKDKDSNIPTFYQNMQDLYQLKEQLLHMQHIFSPDFINYHQMNLISKLKTQISQSQKKISQNRLQINGQLKQIQDKIIKINRQKQELLIINQKLVQSNTNLAEKLERFNHDMQANNQKVQQVQRQKNNEIEKLNKEIQNLKLIHAQQLYILRKKNNKKG